MKRTSRPLLLSHHLDTGTNHNEPSTSSLVVPFEEKEAAFGLNGGRWGNVLLYLTFSSFPPLPHSLGAGTW